MTVRAIDALRVMTSTARLQRSQWHASARIERDQRARLARTLAFAVKHVPYYRQLGIDITHGQPDDCLGRFPILTKQDLQTSRDSLLADGAGTSNLHESRTSGSSGEPTASYFDHSTWLFCKYALKLRRMLNCGLGLGSRVLIVSEADEKKLNAQRNAILLGQGIFFRQAYLSLHAPLRDHLREFEQLQPHAIYAFPSYLSELLEYCDSRGIRPPRVKVVFTSSELLTASLRTRLMEALDARVHDVYGCTELKEVAWQCASGSYHVNHESVWIEGLPEVPASEPGPLLLTTLVNRAAPLIRYRIGDLGRLTWERCECGREGPILRELAGREVELLELPNGRRISPYLLTTAVEDAEGLRQYQFVQTAPDCLNLRFSVLNGSGPDPGELRERLRRVLGEQMQVRVSKVPTIPRTPGGKRQVFVREMNVSAED